MAGQIVDWPNVQGLVLSGYPDLRHAAYLLWKFENPEPTREAREWLWRLTHRITSAAPDDASRLDGLPDDRAVVARSLGMLKGLLAPRTRRVEIWAINLALTPSGLRTLGVDERELGRFAGEFQTGMAPAPDASGAPPRRTNLLGDLGTSSPEFWSWGGWSKNREFDGVLLLYAASAASLRRLVASELGAMRGVAEPVWCRHNCDGSPVVAQGRNPRGNIGHFGIRDGISQPIIEGTRRAKAASARTERLSVIAAGEFVLGYPDTRGAVATYADPQVRGSRDLARNGTYLVARQLDQDVEGFWDFVRAAATAIRGRTDPDTLDWVAAKLFGRYPNGTPLISAPAGSRADPEQRNEFLFDAEDEAGLACPIGAHIRRANPRDVIGPDAETALRLAKMHRVLRRGRIYGRPLRRGRASDAGKSEERGLFFLCLNASIAGQFELIQHSWLNNPQFKDLAGEVDPISHVAGGEMTVQSRPSNIVLGGRKPFVTVRGGAYFFMPGLNALRRLSE